MRYLFTFIVLLDPRLDSALDLPASQPTALGFSPVLIVSHAMPTVVMIDASFIDSVVWNRIWSRFSHWISSGILLMKARSMPRIPPGF